MKLLMSFLVFVPFTAIANAEPPKPYMMSQEEIGTVLQNLPGQMCEVVSTKLTQRQQVDSFYDVSLRNPSGQSCLLNYKVWRTAVTTFPDGSPAPSDYYKMTTTVVSGTPAACPCH